MPGVLGNAGRGPSGEFGMATDADKAGWGREGQGERDQFALAALAEPWAAYCAAVARRDEWVQAYVILCLYDPARGSPWQVKLVSGQVAP